MVFFFFLNFQYQLIARDHKSLQCDLGNILKQNKCILCVPHLFKKNVTAFCRYFLDVERIPNLITDGLLLRREI